MLAIQAEEGEGSGHTSEPQPPPFTAQPTNEEPIPNVVSSSHQKTQTHRQALTKVTELPQTSEPIHNVVDEAIYEEWDDKVERAATTAASLDAEQASETNWSEGFQEIVDGKEFTINEASVRRHLQLANANGISVLPNSKIFDQLSLMGQALNKVTKLPQTSKPVPNVADEAIYEEWDDRVERAATTTPSLDAEQASGGSPRCQEAMGVPLLRLGHTLGSGEDSIKLIKKLMETCTKLSERVLALEESKTAQDLGRSMIKEIDQDAGVTSVQIDVEDQGRFDDEIDFDDEVQVTPTQFSAQGEAHSQEDQPEDQLGVLSAAKEVNISIPSSVVVKDKGKGKMEEYEDEQTNKRKLQQEQDRLGYEAAVRLQKELNEEERQRMDRVYEAAQSFIEEEWENIRARVEADEELTQRLQAEERNKYSEVNQAKMLVDLINQRKKSIKVSSWKFISNNYFSVKVGSSKRVVEAELDYEGSKRQKTNEASGSLQEQPDKEENELS
nr:hypothetical protein [Tanacetum cinerariifolium]